MKHRKAKKKSKKSARKSAAVIAYIIGQAILLLWMLMGAVVYFFFGYGSVNKRIAALFALLLGIGFLLTVPHEFERFENADDESDAWAFRSLIVPLVIGAMSFAAGVFMLFGN